MANLLNVSRSALLLLVALLAAGARADRVTTAECAARGTVARVRRYPVDSNATTLNMDDCSLTEIDKTLLSGLPALTGLQVYMNKLRELPVFDERTCHSMTFLYLSHNQLTSIHNGTFSDCTKLEELDLSHNQIEFIDTSVFSTLTNLKFLALSANKIRYIPDQMFSNNGKLVKLYLHSNRFTHLPADFASRLKRAGAGLDTFTFNDNPAWHCACLNELLADVQKAGVRKYSDYKEVTTEADQCVTTSTCADTRAAKLGR